jgi:hypothetical protein
MSYEADIADSEVYKRYSLTHRLGKYVSVHAEKLTPTLRGAYGVVWKATDLVTKKNVAIKKCYDAFRNSTGIKP